MENGENRRQVIQWSHVSAIDRDGCQMEMNNILMFYFIVWNYMRLYATFLGQFGGWKNRGIRYK